jgi:hypothetical protein
MTGDDSRDSQPLQRTTSSSPLPHQELRPFPQDAIPLLMEYLRAHDHTREGAFYITKDEDNGTLTIHYDPEDRVLVNGITKANIYASARAQLAAAVRQILNDDAATYAVTPATAPSRTASSDSNNPSAAIASNVWLEPLGKSVEVGRITTQELLVLSGMMSSYGQTARPNEPHLHGGVFSYIDKEGLPNMLGGVSLPQSGEHVVIMYPHRCQNETHFEECRTFLEEKISQAKTIVSDISLGGLDTQPSLPAAQHPPINNGSPGIPTDTGTLPTPRPPRPPTTRFR